MRAKEELRKNYAGANLLLAEDNPINREVALELLYAVGLQVDTAENGRIAVDKVFAKHYDCVLIDVQMPQMDGLQATQLIRSNEKYADLPILAMTATAFAEDKTKCLNAGMNDFVAKPVVPDDLYQCLLYWLSKTMRKTPTAKLNTLLTACTTNTVDNHNEPKDKNPNQQPWFHIPGIDSKQGLAVVNGNPVKFRRLLVMFADSHTNDMQQVLAGLDKPERQELQAITHGLKGVAGTLGATKVAKLSAELDTAIRNNTPQEECTALARQCQLELSQLIANIRALDADTPDYTQKQPPSLQTETIFSELKALLAEHDVQAGNLVEIYAEVLHEKLGVQYKPFKQLVAIFDYEAALEILQEIPIP